MMKKLVITMFMAATAMSMLGQNRTIKGTVIDKKTGNYLPGAEISVVGGAESTVTDSDGTFSIEAGRYAKNLSARYAGMRTKKIGITDGDMLIEMSKKLNLDNWFLNFETGFVQGPGVPGSSLYGDYGSYQSTRGTFGLMGGFLGKWGCYIKWVGAVTDCDYVFNITGGVTKRIFPWLHASLGFGGGLGMQCYYNYYTGYRNYGYHARTSSEGMLGFEAGLIFKLSKHFNANINYGVGFDTEGGYENYFSGLSSYNDESTRYYEYWGTTGELNYNLSIGIGYVF